jgi:hypothetical protein
MALQTCQQHNVFNCNMWLKFQVLIHYAGEVTAMFGFQHVERVPLYGLHSSALAATMKAYCYKHTAWICMKLGTQPL